MIAKIAPKDKRFAVAVLAHIAAPAAPSESSGFSLPRRVAGLAQLDTIDAEPAEKVKALVAALGDDKDTVEVIAALQGFGKDAAPALPLLKKLKLSYNDRFRLAATEAVKRIE